MCNSNLNLLTHQAGVLPLFTCCLLFFSFSASVPYQPNIGFHYFLFQKALDNRVYMLLRYLNNFKLYIRSVLWSEITPVNFTHGVQWLAASQVLTSYHVYCIIFKYHLLNINCYQCPLWVPYNFWLLASALWQPMPSFFH